MGARGPSKMPGCSHSVPVTDSVPWLCVVVESSPHSRQEWHLQTVLCPPACVLKTTLCSSSSQMPFTGRKPRPRDWT